MSDPMEGWNSPQRKNSTFWNSIFFLSRQFSAQISFQNYSYQKSDCFEKMRRIRVGSNIFIGTIVMVRSMKNIFN